LAIWSRLTIQRELTAEADVAAPYLYGHVSSRKELDEAVAALAEAKSLFAATICRAS